MKTKRTIRNIMLIVVMCLSLTTAKDVSVSAAEQSEASEPKLCARVTLGYGGVTSWVTYTYVEDFLVGMNDPYKGTETEYIYSESGKTIVTKDSSGAITEESHYNSKDQLIYIDSSSSKYISLKDDQGNEIYHYVKPGGVEQEFSYDGQGRVSEIISNSVMGVEYQNFEYSSDGLHLDVIGTLNVGTADEATMLYMEVDYDSAGHIVMETDYTFKDHFITIWTYDENGRRIGEDQYNGDTLKTSYTWGYDEDGHNDRRIDFYNSQGYTTTHFYQRDENGNIIQTYEEQEDPTDNEIIYTILEDRSVYNDHGDLGKYYTYKSSAETWEDWDTVTFYFYEYDEIPHNIGQLNP